MNDIERAIMGEITVDEAVDREALKYAVQRAIFCPRSGVVLDVRTAVLVSLKGDDGSAKSEVWDGAVWDATGPKLRELCAEKNVSIEITDGRVVNARKGRK